MYAFATSAIRGLKRTVSGRLCPFLLATGDRGGQRGRAAVTARPSSLESCDPMTTPLRHVPEVYINPIQKLSAVPGGGGGGRRGWLRDGIQLSQPWLVC